MVRVYKNKLAKNTKNLGSRNQPEVYFQRNRYSHIST